jgi:DNA primase
MLDFNRIKEIKLTDVLSRYRIALRFKGDYAVCACPLPTHKPGDTGKSFSVNLTGNYWRCFSQTCNANNGGKRGGDVINFVALMDGCREKDAAQKLADWFGAGQNKTAAHMEQPRKEHKPAKDYPDHSKSSDSVKYMQEVDAWFDGLFRHDEQETDTEFRDRLLKSIKSRLVESYRAGQRSKPA